MAYCICINQLICSIFNIFSGMLLSTALQVVVQYEKTPSRLWYWLWCFNMGSLYYFLQRAHGVLVADCNICCPCWFSIRLTFSTSHVRCPRISAFYEQDCQRSSLRCTFPSQTGCGYNASSGRRIFFSSFRSSVHELCSTCFQISHIACNYAEGSIQVWNNVAWEAEYVVLVTFLLLVTW